MAELVSVSLLEATGLTGFVFFIFRDSKGCSQDKSNVTCLLINQWKTKLNC